jgi:hypothetical protein
MLCHSIVSQHFMKPEGSVPNSQELSTCSYPEPDKSNTEYSGPDLGLATGDPDERAFD